MKPKVFIDGSEGTTGLKIHERLAGRSDIELLQIEEALRKDTAERKKLIGESDLVFLCLPDSAAQETAALIENDKTRVIDASTAHRVADGWVYGLPEMSSAQREHIKAAKRVSNPGCHAAGTVLLLSPLVEAGCIPKDCPISITSVTGYTGGGKSMIGDYKETDRTLKPELDAPRLYSTMAQHKHIPEIMKHAGLTAPPLFLPIVADYPQGMQVIVPLNLPMKRQRAYDVLAKHYAGCENIEVSDSSPSFAPSNAVADSDKVLIKVLGYDDIIILTAQFDNLGKGASGGAVQNMNIMLGFDEYKGLQLEASNTDCEGMRKTQASVRGF